MTPKPKPKPKPKEEEPDEENILVDFAELTPAALEKSFGTYEPVNSINGYMVKEMVLSLVLFGYLIHLKLIKADPCETISLNVDVAVKIREGSPEYNELCRKIDKGTECTKIETQSIRFIKHDRLFKLRDFDPEQDCRGLEDSCLTIEVLMSPSMKQELAVSISRQTGSGIRS